VTTLKRSIPKRRFSVRFCPYCGQQKLKITQIHHSSKEHRFCETCCVYFEVQEDWYNDFPENNDEDSPYDCSKMYLDRSVL